MIEWLKNQITNGNIITIFFICLTFLIVAILYRKKKISVARQGIILEGENGEKVLVDRRSTYQSKFEINRALRLKDEIIEIKESSFDTQYNTMKDHFKILKQKILKIYQKTMKNLRNNDKYNCVEPFAIKNAYNYFSDVLGDILLDNMYELVKRIRNNGADKIYGELWDQYKKRKFTTFYTDKHDMIYYRWKKEEMTIDFNDFYQIAEDDIKKNCWNIINQMEDDLRLIQIKMHKLITPLELEINKLQIIPNIQKEV